MDDNSNTNEQPNSTVDDPIGVKEPNVDAIIERTLGHFVRDDEGNLMPAAKAIEALRRDPSRKAFFNIVTELSGLPNADPQSWIRWLKGGAPVYDKTILKRVSTGEESSAKQLKRSSARIQTAEAKVEKRRVELELAESELAEVKSLDKAMVSYLSLYALAQTMECSFAMGPAWTIMRAVSAVIPAEDWELEMSTTSPLMRESFGRELEAKRAVETTAMLEVLDLAGGDTAFLRFLRRAVMQTCQNWREHDRNKGRIFRGMAEMKHRPRAEHTDDVERVVRGVRRSSATFKGTPSA